MVPLTSFRWVDVINERSQLLFDSDDGSFSETNLHGDSIGTELLIL